MINFSFKDFLNGNIIVEELHKELQDIVHNHPSTEKSKQRLLSKKIKELSDRGEKTGIEGNMPKGSSRAYMKHTDKHEIDLDGQKHHLSTGTKVAIKSELDVHHIKENYGDKNLGQLQNEAENGDRYVNEHYRILRKDQDGKFHSNKEQGIFPPLISHDEKNHEYAHIGHVRDFKSKEFESLTKTETHPKGISHGDFYDALRRNYDKNNGKYWKREPTIESHLDHVEKHPLVQKFIDHQETTGFPPHDFIQKRNLGVFEHPDGTKHIVARDHGFDAKVMDAYAEARKRRYYKNAEARKRRY